MPGADRRSVVKSEGLDRRRGYPCYMLIFKCVTASRPIRYGGISLALSGLHASCRGGRGGVGGGGGGGGRLLNFARMCVSKSE